MPRLRCIGAYADVAREQRGHRTGGAVPWACRRRRHRAPDQSQRWSADETHAGTTCRACARAAAAASSTWLPWADTFRGPTRRPTTPARPTCCPSRRRSRPKRRAKACASVRWRLVRSTRDGTRRRVPRMPSIAASRPWFRQNRSRGGLSRLPAGAARDHSGAGQPVPGTSHARLAA